jgi:two-component system CheB/CheR fusion protein
MDIAKYDEKEENPALDDIIIINIPAGGEEALSALLRSISPNFPAPIILAQQFDTRHAQSADFVQFQNNLAVEVVTASSELKPGMLYIVSVHRHVSFANHSIETHDQLPANTPRPSLDSLLIDLAHVYGEHAFVVFLAGHGLDGIEGAIEIKKAGGTVITQKTPAPYNSSSSLLPPALVDFDLPIEEMGPPLYQLLVRARSLQVAQQTVQMDEKQVHENTENILREILDFVSRQASIDFRLYKTSTILRRIDHRTMATHSRTMKDYAEYLKASPEEVGRLVQAFLINVTQFFRDAEAFAYLKSELIPRLITRARTRGRVLRFWTAGCATGEEPYSLAMLLTDLLGAELPEWSIKIFATDLDESAISFARRGIYTDNLLKGMPREYRERFFERVEQGNRISKTLRQMVIFGQQDLSRSAPFPRIDLVLCRNVLIYFTPELQDYVLSQFAFSLCPEGYLFLGKAETIRPAQSFYELLNKHWKVYRCTGSALPAARRQTFSGSHTSSLEGNALSRQSRSGGKTSSEPDLLPPGLEIAQLRHFNELLLRFLPTGVVVIDRSYHILTTNNAARRLLGVHDIVNDQDFLHTVRGIPYQDARTAIDAVFRERNAITLPEVELTPLAGGSGRFVCLSFAPMQLETGFPDLAIISVTDVTEQVQIRRQLETIQAEQTHLMQELSVANKRLSDMNKELMDANEEFQVTNEELVLTHEELQASIEEFETTNEELQAANEELETNNEELQATNEELETTNDELRARTSELQEMTSLLEHERTHLAEIIEHAPFYILVLAQQGSRFIVEMYNIHYARLLGDNELHQHAFEEFLKMLWTEEQGRRILQEARMAYHEETARTLAGNSPVLINTVTEEGGSVQFSQESVSDPCAHIFVPSHDTSGQVNGIMVYTIVDSEQAVDFSF